MTTDKQQVLERLYTRQLVNFPLARDNFKALEQVVCKTFQEEGFRLRIQHNPARIISTNAKTDTASLQNRPCFLCPSGMPEAQKGIPYGADYHIYINPYPIFPRHFIISSNRHIPQRIAGRFGDMLDLADDFRNYTVFYNGPASGASAPDHFHFQLASRHEMPLEAEAGHSSLRKVIHQNDTYTLATLEGYLREVFILESASKAILMQAFERLQQAVGKVIPYEEEPRFNLFAWKEGDQWTVCLFPRRQWRPRQFYETGDRQIMFSPGCADMAGLIIAPRREDFERYTPALLTDLFRQVSITPHEKEEMIALFHQQKAT